MQTSKFKTPFAETIFRNKYAQGPNDNWDALADRTVEDVCGSRWGTERVLMSDDERRYVAHLIKTFGFIPGGRYLYYAGRKAKYFNNCYLLRGEADTREEWANLFWRASSCLMTGGGIGADYSVFRESGAVLERTGGVASGPIPLMEAINGIGSNVMQGGSRRSAIYASLNWLHPDIPLFLKAKNWHEQYITPNLTHWQAKQENFNHRAPLDMTNISVNYDDAWVHCMGDSPEIVNMRMTPTFLENCRQAMMTGEPGFSFNFGDKQNETLRNACTEVTSENDSDVCNLGSINMGAFETLEQFEAACKAGAKFLICGTIRADLPYDKVRQVREKNRRIGLGLMGIHEWLLKRGYKYEVVPELHRWLEVYRSASKQGADEHCDRLFISRPVAYRAIAPTGTIGIVASTTTGIEPLFAVAFKRRFLVGGSKWKYQFVVDATADHLVKEFGLRPDDIETALTLASDYERRIKFQADVQDYVDMSISSTINLPAWGSAHNNEGRVHEFAHTLARYAPRLRGFTCYPDGSRGGQPLTAVPYDEAIRHKGVEFEEIDICDISGKGGSCGV